MKKSIVISILSVFIFLSNNSFAQQQYFKIGDKAPVFESKTHEGKTFNLATKINRGSVLVLFYRGYWCPFCNKQLMALNDSLSLITTKGATVVAITPETELSVDKTIEKTKATFNIISDTSYQILKAYGVNFKVEDKTVERYKNFGVDFAKVNGNNENVLPVPAVYIIGSDGKFKYIWFEKDYRKRPSVKELLDNL